MFKISAETKTISIIAKDTASFNFDLDNYELVDGDKVIFTVASSLESSNPVLQKKITKFSDGSAEIILEPEDTDIQNGKYFYDIQVELNNGIVDTVIGPALFIVEGGVTV